MELWEIMVPTIRRIGGKPYSTRYHRVWDQKVREIAGGLTILKPAKGQWIAGDGQLHDERVIPVRIACTEYQIMQIMDMTLDHYDQLAVFYYQVLSKVIIKKRHDALTPP